MARACSRLLLAALIVGATSCGPAAELTLVLEPADTAAGETTARITSLRVLVHVEGDPQPDRFEIPLDRTKRPKLATTAKPGERFAVDVFGCDTETCTPVDAIARGCTEPVILQEGQNDVTLRVGLAPYDDAAPDATCPKGF